MNLCLMSMRQPSQAERAFVRSPAVDASLKSVKSATGVDMLVADGENQGTERSVLTMDDQAADRSTTFARKASRGRRAPLLPAKGTIGTSS